MTSAKPFVVPKRLIWDAYQRVKANRGAAGVDGQSISDFDRNLSRNLYQIWNRMSSGCYFPPAVKAVPIPKKSGGERILGVPTVSDRIAQTVVTMTLEPILEPVFHDDSYGYRRGKSAHDALAVTRKRCWERDWVLEYDIRGLFDHIDHTLLKNQIQVRTFADWDDVTPGFLEIDLFAHCGGDPNGVFLNTLVMIDVSTGWLRCMPLLKKSAADVINGIIVAIKLMPFELNGLDTDTDADSDSEFINLEMLDFCEAHRITFTGARAYKKNDQAYVEEKNRPVVRRLVGYDRFQGTKAWEALASFYCVVGK